MAETLRGASRLQEAQGAINEAFECALPWKCLLPKFWLEKGLLERLKDRPLEAQCSFGQALRLIESDFLDTPYRHMRNELYANLGAACFEVGDIRGAIRLFAQFS